MARTTCLLCLISTVSGRSKKAKKVALETGTQQNLSNLDFLEIAMLKAHQPLLHKNPLEQAKATKAKQGLLADMAGVMAMQAG